MKDHARSRHRSQLRFKNYKAANELRETSIDHDLDTSNDYKRMRGDQTYMNQSVNIDSIVRHMKQNRRSH